MDLSRYISFRDVSLENVNFALETFRAQMETLLIVEKHPVDKNSAATTLAKEFGTQSVLYRQLVMEADLLLSLRAKSVADHFTFEELLDTKTRLSRARSRSRRPSRSPVRDSKKPRNRSRSTSRSRRRPRSSSPGPPRFPNDNVHKDHQDHLLASCPKPAKHFIDGPPKKKAQDLPKEKVGKSRRIIIESSDSEEDLYVNSKKKVRKQMRFQ